MKYLFKYSGTFSSLWQQVAFFRQQLQSGIVLVVQVGAYFEIYDNDVVVLAELLNLSKRFGFRGMMLTAGRPMWRAQCFVENIIKDGFSVAVILESEKPGRYLKERYLREIYWVVGENNEG